MNWLTRTAFYECTGSCHKNVINRWSVCIGQLQARIAIIAILVHYHPTTLHTVLLTDVTLRCGMYPASKVDISQRLAIPGSPRVTILSTSPVLMLVHCLVKHRRSPDLKSCSNVSLQFTWITGPATDPSCILDLYFSVRTLTLVVPQLCRK